MSKAIRSYPVSQQAGVIKRRRQQAAGGMGYHAAISLKADMIVNGQRAKETEQLAHALDSIRRTKEIESE